MHVSLYYHERLSLIAHPQVFVVRQVDPHLPVAVVQEFEAQMVLVITV